MIDLLVRAAREAPDQLAVVTPEGTATHAQLLDGARRIAGALERRAVARVGVVEPDAGLVLRVLAGAALAGVEACQYAPDVDGAELGHDVVVSRRADLPPTVEVLDPLALGAGAPVDRAEPDDRPQPLVIRTTGTTGAPKSVAHDWRVLGRTVERVAPRHDQRWLLAYGTQQMAGVQVLQHVLAAQATLVAPHPRQPRDGLDALLAHGVTCVSATPTYWRFLLAEARSRRLDLPRLEQITLGGEASSADLLDDLAMAFPDARIAQVYASTELGSVTSVTDGKPGFAADALLAESNPDATLKIVDGELWVRPTAGAAEGWQPTGDLVEVVDGRVVFVGRTSEVINVGGVKVHPLPVEACITALPGVALARVFGRANKLTGAIVAVEVVPADTVGDDDLDALREAIRAAVAHLPRAWHPRSITFVDGFETLGTKTLRTMETNR